MPHQCVHCGKVYPDVCEELLKGCSECRGHFFFYIKKQQMKDIKDNPVNELAPEEKKEIEEDVRDIIGIKEPNAPVILDLESVRVTKPGKFELDIVNLFTKKRPLIYKLEEGKYIIDLASTLKINLEKYKEKMKEVKEKD